MAFSVYEQVADYCSISDTSEMVLDMNESEDNSEEEKELEKDEIEPFFVVNEHISLALSFSKDELSSFLPLIYSYLFQTNIFTPPEIG